MLPQQRIELCLLFVAYPLRGSLNQQIDDVWMYVVHRVALSAEDAVSPSASRIVCNPRFM